MMCNYKCPYAERRPVAGFLLCKNLQMEGVNYNDRANAFQIICPHQKQCQITGQMENDDSARECVLARPATPKTEIKVVEVAEEKPAPTPKAAAKKKTTKKA